MKKVNKILSSIVLLYLLISLTIFSNPSNDSIKNILSKIKNDSALVDKYIKLSNTNNYEDIKFYTENAIKICQKKLKSEKSTELQKYYFTQQICVAYNNLAFYYKTKGNYIEGINYHLKALTLFEKIKDLDGIANVYNYLGNVYQDLDFYDDAIKYYSKSQIIRKKLVNIIGVIQVNNNLATIYRDQNQLDKSLQLFNENLHFLRIKKDSFPLAITLNNIGLVLIKKTDYENAIKHLEESINIFRKVGNSLTFARTVNNFCQALMKLNKTDEALKNLIDLYPYAKKIDNPKLLSEISNNLSECYKIKKQWEKAFFYQSEHNFYIEKVQDDEKKKKVIQEHFKFEYDKKTTTDSLQYIQKTALKNAEIKSNRKQKYFFLIGLVLVIIFSVFLWNRYRIIFKQKKLIEKQKKQVEQAHLNLEEKNKEITDSITYAKRIQTAILPSDNIFKSTFNESFIFYKPKDIVAGDFYWLEVVGDTVLFAAADCTGHGVPGAMVSVVCHNALNRSVREFNIKEPGKILDKTRELVIQEFEKSDEEVKDGMDISLCAYDLKAKKLSWAGANNPLWILRNNSQGQVELLETKPDKQPIGKHYEIQPFTTHVINLEKKDIIYLFTDGLQDQFGGPKKKKFRVSQMKELFKSINHLLLINQKDKIQHTFNLWKGKQEQIDDVCIIGVKI
ncbi:MAG: tetratricopeptide repeat protein [Flavobacteriia bacterium]|nr:tetratricopeptide repeat protein [Flavobacteriia bacterium]